MKIMLDLFSYITARSAFQDVSNKVYLSFSSLISKKTLRTSEYFKSL